MFVIFEATMAAQVKNGSATEERDMPKTIQNRTSCAAGHVQQLLNGIQDIGTINAAEVQHHHNDRQDSGTAINQLLQQLAARFEADQDTDVMDGTLPVPYCQGQQVLPTRVVVLLPDAPLAYRTASNSIILMTCHPVVIASTFETTLYSTS